LHVAAIVGCDVPDRAAALEMLVNECGVDLEARNLRDSTCTHVARAADNADAIRCFISAGANLQSVYDLNRTPLHVHAGGESSTIFLLAAGADVHARDERQRTPCTEVAFEDTPNRSIVNLMLAAGADLDATDCSGNTARQLLAKRHLTFDEDDDQAQQVETARREIAKVRLDFVRHRAWQVCIGLQSRGLDALQMCEVLLHACGPVAPLIEFHQWWKIATTAKHFKSRAQSSD
jgi:hypothetical protein